MEKRFEEDAPERPLFQARDQKSGSLAKDDSIINGKSEPEPRASRDSIVH